MKSIIKNVKNIAWLCNPYWKYSRTYLILWIAISVLLAPIGDIIYIYFPPKVMDLLVSGKPFSYVATFASIVCGIGFITYLIQHFPVCFYERERERVDLKIKRNIYEKAMKIDYKYIDNPEYYNKYTWALNEYVGQTNSARNFINDFLAYFLSITVLLATISTIGPWILLIEAVQLVLHFMINARENKVQLKKKDELIPVSRYLSYYHRLFYLKEYSADIKATSLSDSVFSKYEKQAKLDIEIVNRYTKKTLSLGILHETIFVLTEFIIILYLIYSISIGNIAEVGMYIAMIIAFYRVDSKLVDFIGLLKQANELSLNAEKIREFFNIKSEIESSTQTGKLVPSNDRFHVELRNVGFAYDGSEFALSKMNISIKPGEKIAIVGENGAGKSTFVKLLLRLYDVSSGEILIDGKPIKAYDVRALRRKIGVAFQNSNIYAMTFAENISLYNEISGSELDHISEELGLDSILTKNNVGFDGELTREFDEKGIMVSGGEAQKIALARIMSGDFGLLLLDEPSSALDPIAEYKMSELILGAANKATTIMVAHRLSTTRNADRIVLIDHGEIKESGTHDELMELCGKYYEMFTKQAENYIK